MWNQANPILMGCPKKVASLNGMQDVQDGCFTCILYLIKINNVIINMSLYKWKTQVRIKIFFILFGRWFSFTRDVIDEEIHNKLFEWNIDKNIFNIVLDIKSVNKVLIVEKIPILSHKGTLLFCGKFFHVHCYRYILNLMVKTIFGHGPSGDLVTQKMLRMK